MIKLVVLCCVVAAAAAQAPTLFAPAGIPLASSAGYAVPLQQALYNYRGPLSLAPGQPANILAADGRPLDTLDVNLDRSAHFVAKALESGPRLLKKRSVTRLAVAPGPLGFSAAVAAGNVGIAAPVAFSPTGLAGAFATNPLGLPVPFAARAFSPFAPGPFGLSTPIVANPLTVAAPLTAGSIVAPVAANPIGVPVPGTPFVRNF